MTDRVPTDHAAQNPFATTRHERKGHARQKLAKWTPRSGQEALGRRLALEVTSGSGFSCFCLCFSCFSCFSYFFLKVAG